MISLTNGQDFQNYNGGYQAAMLTMYLALDDLLEELEKDSSATLESAKRRIKVTKRFCLDEFLGNEDDED